MARDISELGADVYDDSPKKEHKISPKKRNYIIGLTLTGFFLVGAVTATIILTNTVLTDYANVENVMYYFTPDSVADETNKRTAVLYRLPSDKKFPSTFRIPAHILGYKVVGVADSAFAGHKEIKKVIMPSTVTFVGNECFKNCTSLSKFTWSKNLVDVGNDAFENTSFYNNLLQDKKALYDLPGGVLIYCGSEYFDQNTAIVSDALKESDYATIKANYTVSSIKKFSDLNVKSICSGAFKNNNRITYIDLPESLDEIPTSTFEGCEKLEGLDSSHAKVEKIGKRAFADCESLSYVSLPSTLKDLEDEAFMNTGIVDRIPDLKNVEKIGVGIFKDCKSLTTVQYNSNIVYQDMFNGCESLTTISWGEGDANINNVTDIRAGAFANTGFTSFVVPKNVANINDNVFNGCDDLEEVSLYGNLDDANVVLPEEETPEGEEYEGPTFIDHNGVTQRGTLVGVSSIKEGAFRNCKNLKTINLYNDSYVESGNDNEFTFPYSLSRCDVSSTGALTSYAFANTSPEKVTFSPNMKHIGGYAFSGCKQLQNVVFEHKDVAQLISLKEAAFQGCSELVSFDLPSSVTRIDGSSFKGCQKLTGLDFASTNVKVLNAYTFYDCQNIVDLELPTSLTSIKKDVFYRTYELNYVVVPASVTEILDRAFKEVRRDGEDPMNVYISRTYDDAHSGSSKINFGSKWKDATVKDFYFLGEDEERVEGRNYWKLNEAGLPEII